MKETKKRRYIVSTIMYGMILIFIQLPWVVLKGKITVYMQHISESKQKESKHFRRWQRLTGMGILR